MPGQGVGGEATGGAKRPESIRIEAYGVRVAVSIESGLELDAVRRVLPPGAREMDDGTVDGHLHVSSDGDVTIGGERVTSTPDRSRQLIAVDSGLRRFVALTAPDRIFVHAGAVALGDRALVLPGESFAGKTTLVAALVRAGATYLSDEFAVLDADGNVHPYAKPLSLRLGDTEAQTDVPVTELGGDAASAPARVAVVAFSEYRAGARWRPAALTAAEGALLLLTHAVAARTRPAAAIAAVQQVAERARFLSGKRGAADRAADALLTALSDGT